MKKYVNLIVAALMTATVCSCASTKKSAAPDKEKNASQKPKESEVSVVLDSNGNVVRPASEAPSVSGELPARVSKKGSKTEVDEYTGWSYIPEKNFSIERDGVKISLFGSTGSFGIYAIPEKGSPVPLLSSYDYFNSTYFSVRIDSKEYRLNRENGVKSEARRTPYGAQMAYTIDNKAQIVLDFSFLPSVSESTRVDMVRVTVYTINLSRKNMPFELKSVFDTSLGENTVAHFSTAARSRINSETELQNMAEHLWVRSSNSSAAIQFLLSGKGITPVKTVALGNNQTFESPSWYPRVTEDKSFSSVISYNNSCVCICWEKFYLDPLRTQAVTFYISVAADGNEPAGKNFLKSLEQGKDVLSRKSPSVKEPSVPSVTPEPIPVKKEEIAPTYAETLFGRKETTSVSSEQQLPSQTPGSKVPAAEEKVPKTPAATEDPRPSEESADSQQSAPVSSVEEQKDAVPETPGSSIDPEYIQNLIDRIQMLEESGSDVDSEEIKRLNEELDSIMLRLGS